MRPTLSQEQLQRITVAQHEHLDPHSSAAESEMTQSDLMIKNPSGILHHLVRMHLLLFWQVLRISWSVATAPFTLWLRVVNGATQSHHIQRTQQRPAHQGAAPGKPSAVISWPGFGILFFWQLGITSHLSTHYDLSGLHLIGSSAGALVSVLSACQIDPTAAVQLAHDLCVQQGVFKRGPWGLAGVWGSLVKQWLQQLLPEDAAERCSGRVTIVVTELPWLTTRTINQFKDKAHLIECALASAHVPWFMDGKACATLDGQRCIDGSFCYILFGHTLGLIPESTPASQLLLFDPWSDRQLRSSFRLQQCLELTGLTGALTLVKAGVAYAGTPEVAARLAVLLPAVAATEVVKAGQGGLASAESAEPRSTRCCHDQLFQTRAGATQQAAAVGEEGGAGGMAAYADMAAAVENAVYLSSATHEGTAAGAAALATEPCVVDAKVLISAAGAGSFKLTSSVSPASQVTTDILLGGAWS